MVREKKLTPFKLLIRSPSQMHLISTLWKWEIDFRLIYLNLM